MQIPRNSQNPGPCSLWTRPKAEEEGPASGTTPFPDPRAAPCSLPCAHQASVSVACFLPSLLGSLTVPNHAVGCHLPEAQPEPVPLRGE